jgi:hypothetical protein
MPEWNIVVSEELTKELEDCFLIGAIVDDSGIRYLTEALVDRFNGLKIEIFSNEHPPPHFRVCYQGECNNFTINDCSPLNGDSLKLYFRNIKKWHLKNKNTLITFWNEKRPTDCPVGNYNEN